MSSDSPFIWPEPANTASRTKPISTATMSFQSVQPDQ